MRCRWRRRNELNDVEKPAFAHNALTVIEENGKELKILRDNMPFGRPGHGEFGTYFIGYSRTPRITETMLQNMFVGRPPGNYDRLLDFSKAVTGSLFFAPSSTFLDDVSGDPPDASADETSSNGTPPGADAAPAPASITDASSRTLNIGSLKGQKDE